AGAPDTRTSSAPCGARRRRERPHDRGHPGSAGRIGPGTAPQGGCPAGHRPDQLDRQHRPARDAARFLRAQPHGTRADRVGGPGLPAPCRGRAGAGGGARGRGPGGAREPPLPPPPPPMAVDEVRYVGEAVAVVVARDRYTAADAMTLVDVSYEPLPPVLDMR